MRKVTATERPRSVLWIAVGNPQQESGVSVFSQFARMVQAAWPDVKQTLFTNSMNHDRFPGQTYHHAKTEGLPLIVQCRDVVNAAMREGELDKADLIVVNIESALVYAALNGIEGAGPSRQTGAFWRLSPIVCFDAKVNYGGEKLTAELQYYGSAMFWHLLGNAYPHLSLVTYDNFHEVDLVKRALREFAPECVHVPVRRMVYYRYTGQLVTTPKKRKAVWSGRANPIKNPLEGLAVLERLAKFDVECEMYIPSGNGTLLQEIKQRNGKFVRFGLGPEQYWAGVQDAKVAIVTSKLDNFPAGYLEMAERGVVLVLPAHAWGKQFLGRSWPLTYSSVEQATAMALEVLEHYETYEIMQEECMRKRFAEEPNVVSILEEIWADFRETMHLRKFTVEQTDLLEVDEAKDASEEKEVGDVVRS